MMPWMPCTARILVCAVMMAQIAGPVAAHSAAQAGRSDRPAGVQTTASSDTRFDWFANKPDPAHISSIPKPRLVRALGRGSYICSAAGFGTQSHCIDR